MAHAIDHSKGKAAFVSFQAPGWHGLGKTFTDRDVTVQDALHEGGLDFTVEKAPNVHRIILPAKAHPDGSLIDLKPIEIISDDSFFTYRTDVNKVLGSKLGSDYTVYQNAEGLAIVDDLLKTGKMKIETAGALYDGAKVFVSLKITEPIIIGNKDVINQYLLLVLTHDGTQAITAMITSVRVVCANTLAMALNGSRNAYKIRHTQKAADRVKEAFQLMGLLEDNTEKVTEGFQYMYDLKIDRAEFMNFIGNVYFDEKEIAELQKGNKEAISTRKRNQAIRAIDYATKGVGQADATKDGSMNMWWALNAVTGAVNTNKYKNADDRFDSLLLGRGAQLIQKATNLAMNPKSIKPLNVQPNLN